jgi:hypothetical protein
VTRPTSASRTIGDLADLVRSKNAGPFWQTLDIFLPDDDAFGAVASAPGLSAEAVAAAYRVDPATVRIFRMASIRVIKVSFPRRHPQGGVEDRDMHAGQQHLPLARLPLQP